MVHIILGYLSMTVQKLGMTEKDWLRSNLIGDVAHVDGICVFTDLMVPISNLDGEASEGVKN